MSGNGNTSILSGGTGGVSKVTPQAAIIINSAANAYDVSCRMRNSSGDTIYKNVQPENFAIMRGELVYAIQQGVSQAPHQQAWGCLGNDTRVHQHQIRVALVEKIV